MPKSKGIGIQFLEALPEDGERRLMLAVLIDAIRTLERQRPATPHFQTYRVWLRERAWMQANDDSQLFSFVSICHALGLDADYVRRCVLRPSAPHPNGPVKRYAAKVEESWVKLAASAQMTAARCPQRQARRKI